MRTTNEPSLDICSTHKTTSKSVKNNTLGRRQELVTLTEKVGIGNVRSKIKTLAQHYEISERAIYRDINWIKKTLKVTDIREAEITLGVASNRALNEALNILSMPDIDIDQRLRSIMVLNSTIKQCREELEAWGIKSPHLTEESRTITKVIIEMPPEANNQKF